MQMESLWKRKEVSRSLPVEREVRLPPISQINSSDDQFYCIKVLIVIIIIIIYALHYLETDLCGMSEIILLLLLL